MKSSKKKPNKAAKEGLSLKPAIFLDRDGTLIEEVDLLTHPDQLVLLPQAKKALPHLKRMGVPIVVITNQPVVARGLITEKEVELINKLFEQMVEAAGGKLTSIYWCPHHPEANLIEYRIECSCRKPSPGLLFKAAKELGLDLKKSFMVGDQSRDIGAGKAAGCTTILVKTGYGGNDQKVEIVPDYVVSDICKAVQLIERLITKQKTEKHQRKSALCPRLSAIK